MDLKENERIDDLEYKGLKIIQNENYFCFGMDSILLSDFAKDLKKDSNILDIGTGTGIISILLSKKTECKKIFALEVQKEISEMAGRSIKLNNLENTIEIINDNIKNIEKCLSPKCGRSPLRSATDRRFGRPLPCQLANQTRVHPIPPEFFTPDHAILCAYAVLAVVSNCYPLYEAAHPRVFFTLSPLSHKIFIFRKKSNAVLRSNLHVLAPPPAFILSQDQTLMLKSFVLPKLNLAFNQKQCPDLLF